MAPQLVKQGIQLVALAPTAGDLAERLGTAGIPVVGFHTQSAGRRRPLDELRRELALRLQELRPNLIHANSLSMSRLAGPVANQCGIPVVGHVRDILRLSRLAISDINCCDRVLAVSQATADWHIAAGLDPTRIHVLYNGVDLDKFGPRDCARLNDASRTGLRSELGLTRDDLLIATIGQLGIRKGVDIALQSGLLLADEFPNLHWALVGQRHSTKAEAVEYEAELWRLASSPGLLGKAHFLGRRNDVADILREVDVVVHAARQEPLGRVLLEAAAVGRAVVATDVGGAREIFPEAAKAAMLIAPESPPALAAALRPLLSDSLIRNALGVAARRRASRFFDVVVRGDELAQHYFSTTRVD